LNVKKPGRADLSGFYYALIFASFSPRLAALPGIRW
jgi:hypothetical protein